MKTFRLLLLTMLITTACLANTRDWKNAMIINVSETDISGASRSDKNIMHYTIETDDMVYYLDYSYKPGAHSNNRAPNIAVNVEMKIAVEGKTAYILDDTGAEVKLHVKKKAKK
jgi:hypothetical protein